MLALTWLHAAAAVGTRLLAQALRERPRHLLGLGLVGARQQHRELVAGRAGRGSRSRAAAPPSRGRRAPAARSPTACPSVSFSSLKRSRSSTSSAPRESSRRREARWSPSTPRNARRLGSAGQLVDLGQAVQLGLVVAALGDVAEGEDDRGGPGLGAHRRGADRQPPQVAVGVVHADHALAHGLAGAPRLGRGVRLERQRRRRPRPPRPGRDRAACGRPAGAPSAPGSPPRPGCRRGSGRSRRARRPRPGARRRSSASPLRTDEAVGRSAIPHTSTATPRAVQIA